ncbi:MAG TPA: tripartite tricarboxylate transporter substrate binding protein [Rubrivivax sp.]|nr:tripartite tricarboxylate transporter substrate binding protein [Rubrivivax sp.]HRY86816.1 tripartite tricarboxylate transporter substrate binding protein [Rubrivivax sp.]HRZ60016.1 tripartite tricarboxylate transporter substrate binding protein [Rubrivivax sp.]
MNQPTTRRVVLGLMAAALALGGTGAWAQAWPTKPITIIVPYPAGGGTDTVARVLADKMAPKLGKTIIVDNKGGAAGILGTDAVAKAAPDGHTLVLSITPSLLINQFLFKKLPYNPQKDLAMVSQIADAPLVLVVRSEVPAKNLDELKRYIAANKGKLAYGSWGIGSAPHLFGSQLSRSLDADMSHVPYKGEAQMMQDVIGGQIQLTFVSGQQARPFVEAGKLRPIAVTGEKRIAAFPGTPTLAEQGMKDDVFKAVGWFAIAAPAATPKAVQQRIADEVRAALKLPDVKAKIESLGYEPTGLGPDEFAAVYKKELPLWQKAVKDSGATLD